MTSLETLTRFGIKADGLLFAPGGVSVTDGAWNVLAKFKLTPADLVRRHCLADWTDENRRQNLDALRDGCRIFSSYRIADAIRILVITEADRSSTTVLLPGEY